MSSSSPSLPPGFRFHPTDEELILHYLRKRAASAPCPVSIIADVDIYKFNPWDLPAKAEFGDREWYFFSPRDRKYPNGVRPNRSAASGYWKATGTDKPIRDSKGNENIGVKKALVFYTGKPPKGVKTNWIMHEYRLAESLRRNCSRPVTKHKEDSMRLDDSVLCRIYQKANYHSLVGQDQQEDSAGEDATNKMRKSFSLSELLLIEDADFSQLSQLLETPISDQSPFCNTNQIQPLTENFSNNFTSQSEASAFVAGNSLKRQRMVGNYCFDECGAYPNPSKKLNAPHIYDQFDISQPFFNQQLLLSSHLGKR